jgi:hypothetical protein
MQYKNIKSSDLLNIQTLGALKASGYQTTLFRICNPKANCKGFAIRSKQ